MAKLLTEMNWSGQKATLLYDLQKQKVYVLPGTKSHYVQGVHIAFFYFQVLAVHRTHRERVTFAGEAFTIFTDYLPAIHILDILKAL